MIVGLPIMLGLVGGAGVGEGVEHVKATLPAAHFSWFGGHDLIWAFGVFFPTFFLLLGESSIYQKFFSAKSSGSVKRAVIGFLIGVIVVEVTLTLYAVAASTHPKTHAWRTTHVEYVEAAEAGAPTAELDEKWDALMTAVIRSEGEDTTRPCGHGGVDRARGPAVQAPLGRDQPRERVLPADLGRSAVPGGRIGDHLQHREQLHDGRQHVVHARHLAAVHQPPWQSRADRMGAAHRDGRTGRFRGLDPDRLRDGPGRWRWRPTRSSGPR